MLEKNGHRNHPRIYGMEKKMKTIPYHWRVYEGGYRDLKVEAIGSPQTGGATQVEPQIVASDHC